MRARVYMWAFALVLLAWARPSVGQVSPNNEFGTPLGSERPTRWVIVIHGGGWSVVGRVAVAAAAPNASFFRAHGWGTYNIDYRPGVASLGDVLAAYDVLRHRVGSAATICAWGASAGGNLALLLAAWRPRVACVIAEGAPTDLLTWPHQPAWAPAGVSPYTGPEWAFQAFAIHALGRANLAPFSPVTVAGRIRVHVLLGSSSYDYLVPQAQMTEFASVHRDTTTMLLAGAWTTPPNFTHAGVTARALAAWQRAELTILKTATRSGAKNRSGTQRSTVKRELGPAARIRAPRPDATDGATRATRREAWVTGFDCGAGAARHGPDPTDSVDSPRSRRRGEDPPPPRPSACGQRPLLRPGAMPRTRSAFPW